MLIGDPTVNNVGGLDDLQRACIKAFLQGAVYTWCKHRGENWFAARDLVGGEDFDWQGTPLIALYSKYADQGRADAVERGGRGHPSSGVISELT